jgi:ribosomal protein S27E
MKARIIAYHGCNPHYGSFYYSLEAENGFIFDETAQKYYSVGTVFNYPEDAVAFDSGFFHVLCDGCGHDYWGRSRPGGKIVCEVCNHSQDIPEEAIPQEYEPLDCKYFMEDGEEE